MPEVSMEIQSAERRRPLPEEGPLIVVFEDEYVIVLDKPPGVVVHPTYKNWSGTLLNSVLWRMRDRADAQPGILTRLDKDTSGLVVMALTPQVHAAMQRDQAAGRIRKNASRSSRVATAGQRQHRASTWARHCRSTTCRGH